MGARFALLLMQTLVLILPFVVACIFCLASYLVAAFAFFVESDLLILFGFESLLCFLFLCFLLICIFFLQRVVSRNHYIVLLVFYQYPFFCLVSLPLLLSVESLLIVL